MYRCIYEDFWHLTNIVVPGKKFEIEKSKYCEISWQINLAGEKIPTKPEFIPFLSCRWKQLSVGVEPSLYQRRMDGARQENIFSSALKFFWLSSLSSLFLHSCERVLLAISKKEREEERENCGPQTQFSLSLSFLNPSSFHPLSPWLSARNRSFFSRTHNGVG